METAHSLAIKHPDIAAELHPTRNPGIDPRKLGARSGLRPWWRCPDGGHEWQAKVYVRHQRRRLPSVPAIRPGPGGQTFADARPDLVAERHPTRNGDLDPQAVSAHSARKVWWRCAECGREWQATVAARWRSPRGGCRQCTRARRQREPTTRDVLRDPSPQTSGNTRRQASPRSGPARLRHAVLPSPASCSFDPLAKERGCLAARRPSPPCRRNWTRSPLPPRTGSALNVVTTPPRWTSTPGASPTLPAPLSAPAPGSARSPPPSGWGRTAPATSWAPTSSVVSSAPPSAKREADSEYEHAITRAGRLGLSHREIAAAAHVSHGTIRAILARATPGANNGRADEPQPVDGEPGELAA